MLFPIRHAVGILLLNSTIFFISDCLNIIYLDSAYSGLFQLLYVGHILQ